MKEMKIDDLRAVKSEEVKEPAPHEKAAQNEEKTPSRTSDAFEAIGDDDILW